jgi:hypothetical protein
MPARHGNDTSASTRAHHRAWRRACLGSALVAALVAPGCNGARKPVAEPPADVASPAVEDERADDPDCTFARETAANIDDLCQAIAARFENGASCDPAESHLDTAITSDLDIDDEALTSAALFSLYVPENFSDHVYIALRYRGAWHVSPLVTIYNPGAFGIYEALEINRFDSEQLIPGGSPEVVVEMVKGRSDTDLGIDEEEGSTRAVVAVAGVLDGTIKHVMAVEKEYRYQRDRMGLREEASDPASAGDDAGEDAADAAADDAAPALPIERASGVSVRFLPERGSVVIEAREDLEASHAPGVYTLRTFPVQCLPPFEL